MTDSPQPFRNEAQAVQAQAGISDSAALLELSSILNSSQDLDFILGNVLLTAMGKLMLTRAVVLTEQRQWQYEVRAVKGIVAGTMGRSFTLAVNWSAFLEITAIETSADGEVAAFALCCRECGIVALIPMILNGRMVGIVGVGGKGTGRPFVASDVTLLESIAAIAASAVNNAVTIAALQGSNRQLDTKVQEMNTLFELSREMNATFDEQNILRTLGYALMGQLRVMRYAILAIEGPALRPLIWKLPEGLDSAMPNEDADTLRDPVVFGEQRPPRNALEARLHDLGMRVLIPMLTQNETRGVLCLGERLGMEGYDPSEVEYLSALANISIAALENARMVLEMVGKREMERELALARTIQKGLLPAILAQPAGYDIAAVNESSQQVGGDYYDVIPLSETEFVIAIGDVSGKGIPASLLMANVQAALRTMSPLRLPLPDATARLNDLIFGNTQADKFITFFWGILDTMKHTFTYVNAGHNPPYIVHADGSFVPLSTGGLILGVFDEIPPYNEESVTLLPGDVIVTYTDGVNEALSTDMEEFGNERLEELLVSLRHEASSAIIDRVRADILSHTIGAKQSDDITMLVVKRL